MANLYYLGSDSNLNNPKNWYLTANVSSPANRTPTTADDAIILSSVGQTYNYYNTYSVYNTLCCVNVSVLPSTCTLYSLTSAIFINSSTCCSLWALSGYYFFGNSAYYGGWQNFYNNAYQAFGSEVNTPIGGINADNYGVFGQAHSTNILGDQYSLYSGITSNCCFFYNSSFNAGTIYSGAVTYSYSTQGPGPGPTMYFYNSAYNIGGYGSLFGIASFRDNSANLGEPANTNYHYNNSSANFSSSNNQNGTALSAFNNSIIQGLYSSYIIDTWRYYISFYNTSSGINMQGDTLVVTANDNSVLRNCTFARTSLTANNNSIIQNNSFNFSNNNITLNNNSKFYTSNWFTGNALNNYTYTLTVSSLNNFAYDVPFNINFPGQTLSNTASTFLNFVNTQSLNLSGNSFINIWGCPYNSLNQPITSIVFNNSSALYGSYTNFANTSSTLSFYGSSTNYAFINSLAYFTSPNPFPSNGYEYNLTLGFYDSATNNGNIVNPIVNFYNSSSALSAGSIKTLYTNFYDYSVSIGQISNIVNNIGVYNFTPTINFCNYSINKTYFNYQVFVINNPFTINLYDFSTTNGSYVYIPSFFTNASGVQVATPLSSIQINNYATLLKTVNSTGLLL